MRLFPFVILSGIMSLSGCAYIRPHSDTLAQDRYDTYAPKYTDAQKASMSTEQKLDEYNKHVRQDERLRCRRERTVGTHFRKTVCKTNYEQSDERVAAQEYLRSQRQYALRLSNSRGSSGSLGPNPARGCP